MFAQLAKPDQLQRLFCEQGVDCRPLQASQDGALASFQGLCQRGRRAAFQRCLRLRGTQFSSGRPQTDHDFARKFPVQRRETKGLKASVALHASPEEDVVKLKSELLSIAKSLERGTKNSQEPEKLAKAMELLQQIDAKNACTDISAEALTADWKLVWTTEKETLFILQRAGFFGTTAGDVWQIIDAETQSLNNIIEFPPSGRFAVAASIRAAAPDNFKRVDFRFESAKLVTELLTLPVPPFGKGWFQTVYIDEHIRIAKDSRKDWLIVERSERNV